jgi:hypothetical protein
MSLNPIKNQLDTIAKIQRVKYHYSYTVAGIIANGSSLPLTINVSNDADFHLEQLTISARGPVNSDGTPIGTGDTTGETGASEFPNPENSNRANAGLFMSILDQGAGRQLISGEIPIQLIGTPAYGTQFYMPFKMNYLAMKNSSIVFTIRNADLAQTSGSSQQYHSIEIAMHGYKYIAELG